MKSATAFLFLCLVLVLTLPAQAGYGATPSLMGPLGLNTVPNARMDDPGTVRLLLSAHDPYANAHLGLQIAGPLYIGIRQSAQTSSLNGAADRLYPGVDFKLRLMREGPVIPEIALGLQSALGHKRMAGEYLVFSKRWNDFDFTGGMGWGRMGGAAHIGNPLKIFGGHFGRKRNADGEMPNDVNDWFTGEDIGLFGGIEYNAPWLAGLSLKADWNADRWTAEQAVSDYDPPDPWSLGFSYSPASWIDIGAAVTGGEKIMGTISFQGPLSGWPRRAAGRTTPSPLLPHRTGEAQPDKAELDARRDDILLYNIKRDGPALWAMMETGAHASLPFQLGRAARPLANNGGADIEELYIIPTRYGLRGPAVKLMRADLERTLAHDLGSPQEIWRGMEIQETLPENLFGPSWQRPFRGFLMTDDADSPFRLILDNQISLSEEDYGLLYRTSLIAEEERSISTHLMTGAAVRIDLKNNLDNLNALRPLSFLPVRSNVDRFAKQTVSLDRLYLAWTNSLSSDLHIAVAGGELEEMYSGLGGEILYRPFGRTFAIGAEAWQVFKRNPEAFLNLGFNGDHLLTGHVNAWYEIPETDLTVQARIGRYLAEDIGATLALEKRLRNGVKMRAHVTATGNADFDVFGGTTHLFGGIQLTLPFGDTPVTPAGSAVRVAAAPLGRDTGQSLDPPLSLYEMSQPLSYRHITENWLDIVE